MLGVIVSGYISIADGATLQASVDNRTKLIDVYAFDL